MRAHLLAPLPSAQQATSLKIAPFYSSDTFYTSPQITSYIRHFGLSYSWETFWVKCVIVVSATNRASLQRPFHQLIQFDHGLFCDQARWFMSLSGCQEWRKVRPHFCNLVSALQRLQHLQHILQWNVAAGGIARTDCKDARPALIQHLAMPDMLLCHWESVGYAALLSAINCDAGAKSRKLKMATVSSTWYWYIFWKTIK